MKTNLRILTLAFLTGITVSCNLWEEEEEVTGDVRDRFVGSWTATEKSKLLGNRNYTMTIEKDSSFPSRVNMYNLYQLGTNSDSLIATVSSIEVNTITITKQTRKGNFITGVGQMINDNKINFDYTVDDGNDIDSVATTLIR